MPTVCGPLCGQQTDLAKDQHPFLRELQLADDGSTTCQIYRFVNRSRLLLEYRRK